MRPIFRIVSLVTLCLAWSRSAEYAEFGDNVITYFRGSPVPEGLKKILRLGRAVEDTEDKTTRIPGEFYESDTSDKPIKKYTRKQSVNKYLSSDNSAQKVPLLEYKLDKALKRSIDDMKDVKRAADKARILKKAKVKEELLNAGKEFDFPRADESATGLARFHMDPVMNMLRSSQYRKSYRRQDGDDDDDDSGSSASNNGNLNWKDEWTRLWRYKKYEALNSKRPRGDSVNMVAARPWGVPCGDPNQHDMPWGNCMLSAECEAEFRIYRGDFFCGRTKFVCCGLQVTTYDLYQGLDVSFDDKSLSTDSDERREDGKGGNDKNSKKRQQEKRKRKRERDKRKRKIKSNIAKIVREIRKILDRAYKNGTKERKRKTRMFKKFVKHLKRQYKKDRLSIKELHEEQILIIDASLMTRLNQIRAVNEEFMNNHTFAEIIMTGKASKAGARMLMEAYPELTPYINLRRSGTNESRRRRNKRLVGKPLKDYLDYDIEYGFFYD